jgi:hypothetical protein
MAGPLASEALSAQAWPLRGLPTRIGSGAWIRLGFIVPWREPVRHEVRERPAPVHARRGCEAQRSGLPCHHHDLDDLHDAPIDELAHAPNRVHALRYPLFGREIDYGRNQWEYHAWDAQNDVRIPVGVQRNQWQLQNGDLVELLGDTGLWAVVLTEFY